MLIRFIILYILVSIFKPKKNNLIFDKYEHFLLFLFLKKVVSKVPYPTDG